MYMTNNLIDNAARQAMVLGRQEGMALGEQRGRQEGMALGEQRGRQEILLKMLNKGLPIDQVAELTSLDRKVVEQVAQSAKKP